MARLVSWLVAFALLLVVGAISTPSKHHRDVAVRMTRRQSARRCPNRNRPAIAALNTTSTTPISSTSSTRASTRASSSSRLVTSTQRAAVTTVSSRPVSRPAHPGFMPGTHAGDGTYYDAGLGACGLNNTNTDFIVAVSTTIFDTYPGAGANPNLNPICKTGIKAWRAGHVDRAVNVIVTDRCGGCATNDLDFTYAAFLRLGALGEGRIKIEWEWAESA